MEWQKADKYIKVRSNRFFVGGIIILCETEITITFQKVELRVSRSKWQIYTNIKGPGYETFCKRRLDSTL